jgi:hypothetical protein
LSANTMTEASEFDPRVHHHTPDSVYLPPPAASTSPHTALGASARLGQCVAGGSAGESESRGGGSEGGGWVRRI